MYHDVVFFWTSPMANRASSYGCFQKIDVPQNGWCIIEKRPIKMDDMGIPLFSETSIYIYIYINKINHTVGLRQSYVEAGFPLEKNRRRRGKGVGVSQNGWMNFV